MQVPRALVSVLVLSFSVPSFADFQYTETTTITGGSIVGVMKMAGTFSKQARQANEPISTTVIVQGNRMARINNLTTEIVDLDKETVTNIDNQKKTYTVMTFAQLKAQMDAAAAKAREQQAKAKKEAPAQEQPADSTTKLNFKVNVRNTTNTKQIAGLDANESILNMTMEAQDTKTGNSGNMAITNDMWMVPEVPGYQEVRDFELRYAKKMGVVFSGVSSSMLASMQPGSGEGMAEMVKEMSKLKGTPVQQIMRMGTTANGQPLPAASEAPLPESNTPPPPSAGDVAKEGVANSISSKLGGLGGFGGFGKKKKKDEDAPPPDQNKQTNQTQAQPQAAVLMESKTEMTSFSRGPVDVSKFEVPAGFKQVEPRSLKGE